MTTKTIYPENIDQAKALMQFLVNEKERHQTDIANIETDIWLLWRNWDIEEIPEPNHTFMKVKE